MWRKDKRQQPLEVLQLHAIPDWPNSSTDWGWNVVTKAGPTPFRREVHIELECGFKMNNLPPNKPKLEQAAFAVMLFCEVPKPVEEEI